MNLINIATTLIMIMIMIANTKVGESKTLTDSDFALMKQVVRRSHHNHSHHRHRHRNCHDYCRIMIIFHIIIFIMVHRSWQQES